jgi:hypothetical protein
MADIAVAGAVRAFTDIMSGRIPVIGQGVEIFHFDAGRSKSIPHRRNQAQGGQCLLVPRTATQQHPWTGRGMTAVTIVAIAICRPRVATVTRHFAFVFTVGDLRRQFCRPDAV